jgi:hypothetical protein
MPPFLFAIDHAIFNLSADGMSAIKSAFTVKLASKLQRKSPGLALHFDRKSTNSD